MTKEARECILSLQDKQGRIDPDQVIAEAKKKSSPLHDLFEWDLEKAAYTAWVERARDLIQVARVERWNESTHSYVKTVAFVRDPRVPTTKQGYVLTERARTQPQLAHAVLVNEVKQIKALVERLIGLASYFGMETEAAALLKCVNKFSSKLPEKAA
jgi:hypothetical protein